MKTLHIFLALFLILTYKGYSTTPDFSRPQSLVELIDIALKNNPETKQAWWNGRRAAAALGSAKSAYYPQIGMEGSLQNGKDFQFINGPDESYTIVSSGFTLSMILYDFGERSAGVEEAKMALIAADWQNNWAIQSVLIQVLENVYATLHAQETLDAALISVKDAEQLLSAAEELNRAGLSPITDAYTSRSTYAQMKMDAIEQKSQLVIQRAKLASVLGIDVDTPLQLAPITYIPSPEIEQTAALIQLARQQRADLMAKRAEVAASKANQKKVSKTYAPKLALNGNGGMEHAVHDNTQAGHYNILLSFDIPLFTGFDRIYQNRMAHAETFISKEELIRLDLDIALEVLSQSSSLEAAHEMLCFANDYLENAAKAYEGTLEKYRAGRESIAEVSNAQVQLANARVSYSEVKTRLLVSMANLAYATGSLGSIRGDPCLRNH